MATKERQLVFCDKRICVGTDSMTEMLIDTDEANVANVANVRINGERSFTADLGLLQTRTEIRSLSILAG